MECSYCKNDSNTSLQRNCIVTNLFAIMCIMPFIKGVPNCRKGLKIKGEWRDCLRCGKNTWFAQHRIKDGGGKYCSRVCSNISNAKRGEESWNYKKDVGYYAVHDWLKLNFGKASECEKCGNIKNVQWAKKKGCDYLRRRENFWQLCAKCHMYYDGTIITMQKKKI